METAKNLTGENQELEARLKVESLVNELSDVFTQIWAISNILRLLYDLLRRERPEVAEPSSVIVTCIWQLDYIYEQSEELLDMIIDYGLAGQTK